MKRIGIPYFSLLLIFLISTMLTASPAPREKVNKSYTLNTSRLYNINIEIDAGEVRFLRSRSSNKLEITLRFTEREFDYNIDFDEDNRELRLKFEKESWVDRDGRDIDAEIDVFLPEDVPLELFTKIKAGKVEMDLGGLSLKRFELQTYAGEVEIDFDKPNQIEMRTFRLNTKVGETRLRRLGNARFRVADIDNGIGSLRADFSGAMEEDAAVSIDLDIGETEIYVPDETGARISVKKFLFLSNVEISGSFHKSGRYYVNESYGDARRNFEISVSPGIGALSIVSR